MRTKTVLLTALLGAASIASSVAQTVYSVNAVGYVNVTIPAGGFALLANPLNQTVNSITSVLPSVPNNTILYVINKTTGQFNTFTKRSETLWSGTGAADVRLDPGVGFFLKNPTAEALTVTFVGEVPQTTDTAALSVAYNAGFNLVGSIVPQSGGLVSTLGYTPTANDVVYRFDTAKQSYVFSTYRNPTTGWTGISGETEPQISVAQGFWLNAKTSGTWTRTFTIGN